MSNDSTSVILVEDDKRLAELVSRYLENHGFRVSVANTGEGAAERIIEENPDLVILDLGLPGQDGFAICRRLRPATAIPIMIMTARDNDIDHVLGLELGADDYVIKPVEPRVLMARVKALLRRGKPAPGPESRTLRFGGLSIKTASRSVDLNGRAIPLSSHEFDLLAFLASNAGEVQSRDTLFQHLYNREYDGVDRMLDIRVSHLRRKLGDDADNSAKIKTIWGQGYMFVPDAW